MHCEVLGGQDWPLGKHFASTIWTVLNAWTFLRGALQLLSKPLRLIRCGPVEEVQLVRCEQHAELYSSTQ